MRRPDQISPDHAAVLATLARSVPSPPSAVRAGAVARTAGVARPGPAGPLVAPFSGRPCVWFRALEWRVPPILPLGGGVTTRPVLPPVVTSDMGLGVPGVTSHESPEPFVIADGDGSGQVLVDPRGADVDAPTVTVDTVEGDYGFTEYVLRREWVLPEGEAVFALGPAFADGNRRVLRAGTVDGLMVSGRGEQAAVARSNSFVAARGSTPLGGMRLPSTTAIIVIVATVVVLLAVLGAVVAGLA